MKRLTLFLLTLAAIGCLALVTVGCQAQVPPATPHQVTLTWQAPSSSSTWSGCTTAAPCAYAVYRCTGTATACGTLSSTAWAELTTATTRPSGTSYVDATVAGGTSYTYAVETVQGSDNSGPSNTTTATVPQTPAAPSVGSPAIAQDDGKPLPPPMAELARVGAVTGLHAGS